MVRRTQLRVEAATKRIARKAPAKKAAAKPAGGLGGLNFAQFLDTDPYKNADKGSTAKGAQRAVGYKGSGQKGSAPLVDSSGKKAKFGGKVFRFSDKYGGQNVDEYSPIFTPETRSSTGDTYAAGPLGLLVWFGGFSALLATGAYAIFSTSALAN